MAKLSLKAEPIFALEVGIPVAGGSQTPVQITFKHRRRADFLEWIKSLHKKNRVDAVMECAIGWELEEPFTLDSVKELDQNYMGAADAIVSAYLLGIQGERLKN